MIWKQLGAVTLKLYGGFFLYNSEIIKKIRYFVGISRLFCQTFSNLTGKPKPIRMKNKEFLAKKVEK
jgi:hypothetical protein